MLKLSKYKLLLIFKILNMFVARYHSPVENNYKTARQLTTLVAAGVYQPRAKTVLRNALTTILNVRAVN